MNEIIINGKNALSEFGIRMGDDFLNTLLTPVSMKDFIENKSRLEHGKQVLYHNPRVDERDLTLTFYLEGDSPEDHMSKYKAFLEELLKGQVVISVPVLGETYKLTYQKAASFGLNTTRTFSKIAVKFNEPNPNDK